MGEAGIALDMDIFSTLQEDPDRLEEWAHRNLVKLGKVVFYTFDLELSVTEVPLILLQGERMAKFSF